MFKWFHNEVEKQIEKSIKTFRSDRRREYLSNEFLIYLKENRILSQWIPHKTSQHNGVSKRKNRTLLDIVRSIMGFASLSIFFRVMLLKLLAIFWTTFQANQSLKLHMRCESSVDWHSLTLEFEIVRLMSNVIDR